MRRALLLGLLLGQATIAFAGCRQDGVEWIIGGSTGGLCPAAREAATPSTAARAGANQAAGTQRINAATQSLRDAERLAILQQELADELAQQPLLAADPAALARSRANRAALDREIARLKPTLR